MILIFGGAKQGQPDLVYKLVVGPLIKLFDLADFAELTPQERASLKRRNVIILDCREWLKLHLDSDEAELEKELDLLCSDLSAQSTIIVEDIGEGIVPIDPEERQLREQNGRLLQILANKARRVYRVFAGRALCLKDE